MRPAVVIGVGNVYRRDDGIGPAVAAELDAGRPPGLRVLRCATESTALLDAWAGTRLAVVVDAAVPDGAPGRVRLCAIEDFDESAQLSSHDLGLRQAYELACTLDRAPDAVQVITIEAADTGHGVGLSPAVRAAVPEAVRLVRTLLGEQPEEPTDEQS